MIFPATALAGPHPRAIVTRIIHHTMVIRRSEADWNDAGFWPGELYDIPQRLPSGWRPGIGGRLCRSKPACRWDHRGGSSGTTLRKVQAVHQAQAPPKNSENS